MADLQLNSPVGFRKIYSENINWISSYIVESYGIDE